MEGRALVVALKFVCKKLPETGLGSATIFGNTSGEPREAWPLKKTAKGMEPVIKTRNSVNGTQISIGKFHRKNGTSFTEVPLFPEIFQ